MLQDYCQIHHLISKGFTCPRSKNFAMFWCRGVPAFLKCHSWPAACLNAFLVSGLQGLSCMTSGRPQGLQSIPRDMDIQTSCCSLHQLGLQSWGFPLSLMENACLAPAESVWASSNAWIKPREMLGCRVGVTWSHAVDSLPGVLPCLMSSCPCSMRTRAVWPNTLHSTGMFASQFATKHWAVTCRM